MGHDLSTARGVHAFGPPTGLIACLTGSVVVADPDGDHAGVICVPPQSGVLLSITLGSPSLDPEGRPAPRAALTGVHEHVRYWRTEKGAALALVTLTPTGAALLFPHAGALAGTVTDLGAVIGDGAADALTSAVTASPTPRDAITVIERFLEDRWVARAAGDVCPAVAALSAVAAGCPVGFAAARAGVSRRTLHRTAVRHLGIAPGTLYSLTRLQRSVGDVQGCGDGSEGYADQAHQIRDWRRRLEVTPGAYRRSGASRLARALTAASPGAHSLYL